jgi:N-acetylmuramoyl-L-alanine amidase
MSKRYTLFLVFALLILHGCVSAPARRESLAATRLNGADYFPLIPLCESARVRWEYDMFTRAVLLEKDDTSITVRTGDELVLVNDEPLSLGFPVVVHRGSLMVPRRFKERVWDVFISPRTGSVTICKLPGLKKIVIDAGHGGRDPGAISRKGIREKDINLDIAKRLATLLRQDGIDVVMTRSTDVFIPLEKRSEIAHRSGAEAFVSIHSNSSRRKTLHGFEVYYVSNTAYDPKRARRARAHGAFQLTRPAYAAEDSDSPHDAFTQSRTRSITLASSVARSTEKNLGVTILGVKPARFEVLKSAYMPAVLVEVGFLSNSYEERRLGEPFYRQRMAESIADGIRGYAGRTQTKETTAR